ncbi:hypothetical protein OHB36_01970 [Streptomyces sp. NBC_00320]|uniref:hypothetical protein n=1 Tax=Streptomyces sp. NBC_00320 TaxID=2975711 RepID=UPI00224EA7EF|nr:hypothetical protein [Streptomyces sp. NBC_00320]MCX5145554.1 hypothetical protein [Streptomyces sp. NBC_00320]
MSGDQPDLGVSKQALDQIAKGITDTLSELEELGMVGAAGMGRGFSHLGLSGMQTGHDSLASTLRTFCQRWEWGVRSLVQQGNGFAASVGLSAGLVHEQDQNIQGSFKVAVNAAWGNPYASEDAITGKGWGDVVSDNPFTQIRDADYSRESFDRSSGNIKEAWKGAAHDVNSSDMLLSNQVIDAAGLRGEVDDVVEDVLGPAPEGHGR